MAVQIAGKFQFLRKPKRIKVMYGGRGGAKTISIVRTLLLMTCERPLKVLCLREFMNSIDDSVHGALVGEMSKMGVDACFDAQAKSIDSVINDSIFRYGQLSRNISSIKSKYDFDVAWVEEAETITAKSLDYLIPTFRKEGSEIWLSFNPDDEFGAAFSEYVKPHLDVINEQGYYEDDELIVVKVGLEDNPFAPQELIDASASMKIKNYKKWLHIYGGECFADYEDSIIQPEWIDAAIDAHKKLNFKPLGVRALGFDPADSGDDDKAIALRHGSVVISAKAWGDGELPDAIDIAFDKAYKKRAEVLVYDADGLGAGVKVGLDKRIEGKRLIVEAYKGGAKVDNPDENYIDGDDEANIVTNKDTFKNKRAQYWWFLRDRFEKTYNAIEHGVYTDPAELISLSSDIECLGQIKSELCKVQRKRTNNSLIQIESKPDMKKRGVKSPNVSDALVMCFANQPISIKKTRSRKRRVSAAAV